VEIKIERTTVAAELRIRMGESEMQFYLTPAEARTVATALTEAVKNCLKL